MKTNLKGLRSLDKKQLKNILGGYPMCPEDLQCGNDWCCINGACRPISQAGPGHLCMAILDPVS